MARQFKTHTFLTKGPHIWKGDSEPLLSSQFFREVFDILKIANDVTQVHETSTLYAAIRYFLVVRIQRVTAKKSMMFLYLIPALSSRISYY